MDERFGVADFPATRMVVARATCAKHEVGPTISRLFSQLATAGEWVVGPPLVFYHDWQPASASIEAALPIGPDATPPGHEVKVFAATKVLLYEHSGPYAELPQAWESFWKLADEYGFQGLTPCFDRYVVGPDQESNPARWVTELYIPIQVTKIG